MKRERRYLFIILLTLGVLVYYELVRPQPVDWRESYASGQKIPYGAYALRELLAEIFPGDSIIDTDRTVYNTLEQRQAFAGNYIFVNNNLDLDRLDLSRLLELAERGGSIFIAAKRLSENLKDTLGLETGYAYFGSDSMHFVNPRLRGDGGYAIGNMGSTELFDAFDSATTTVLGTMQSGQANFVRVRYGHGAFYLNTLPLAFTNYHLLDSIKIGYPFRALSYLPQAATIWDEYYKVGRRQADTPLRYLLSQEALRWAYFLLLAGVALFVLVHARRRQRIIPEIAPPANATLDFVETVGMLYLNSGSHAGIARKQIAYLLEQMRSTYGVKTEDRDEELFGSVAKRAGVPAGDVRALFAIIGRIERREAIAEAELIELNGAIEKFNNEKER